jgi:hypothetical protein
MAVNLDKPSEGMVDRHRPADRERPLTYNECFEPG